ncbi:hypothetical protein OG946_02070 [Streptomyces sp. NBC_01808]|uniref:TrmB family transcriptional regulator n=1 Tax=Streptomyces sp. NBC_01808 TaxID=2975947 RepID=UPI002DD8F360|nr:hypothetical protein [Streptomyces sp. NBC_01808]WSA36260.1 hypothetical protein OG946_02070 [Streptomyces sp. NBC_01808]
MSKETGSLGGLGIPETAERLYRDLVMLGPATPDSLTARCGLDREEVERCVQLLRHRGLVDGGATLAALPPQLTLGELVAHREHAARRARAAMEELTAAHRARTEHDSVLGIEVVRGAERIAGWVTHLLRTARKETRFFGKPPFTALGITDTLSEEQALARRGVRERLVYEPAVLDVPEAEKELLVGMDRGQEIRLAPELPCKLLIADDALAVVQHDGGGTDRDSVLVVRRGGLLASLTALFELQWAQAVQLREGFGRRAVPGPMPIRDIPVEEDRKLLALLLTGHTDNSAAVRLGMGRRTVQRRIRRLMDRAGTDSRIQLGWYARDRGWL